MPKPTYESLWTLNEGLFELMEFDHDLRTWQMRVIRDVRGIVQDKMREIAQERAIQEEEEEEEKINNGPFGVGA